MRRFGRKEEGTRTTAVGAGIQVDDSGWLQDDDSEDHRRVH